MFLDHIEFPRPICMHGHYRRGLFLKDIVEEEDDLWSYALAMPNRGIPPVLNASHSLEYRAELDAAKGSSTTEFLIPMQLTHNTTKRDIREGWEAGVFGLKIFPTCDMKDSDFGITRYDDTRFLGNLAVAEKLGMPCLWHCAKRGEGIGFLDAEIAFVEEILVGILGRFPGLRSSIEHVSMASSIEVLRDLRSQGCQIVATITPQHPNLIWLDAFLDRDGTVRNASLACKPPLNTPADRNAIREVMTSGERWIILGRDSAPWDEAAKAGAHPAFGTYSPAGIAIPLYVQTFELRGGDWFEHFANFAWRNAIDFYHLSEAAGSKQRVRLVRKRWRVPATIRGVKPLWAGHFLDWQVEQS